MPELTLIPPVAAAVPPRRRWRVFVSYAHQDARKPSGQHQGQSLLDTFKIQLRNLRHTLASRGCQLHPDEIFIDSERLNAGEAWRDEIGQALDECDVLVFLVSPDSRASDFCVTEEVSRVARRGKLIVPLLLRETADWAELQLVGAGLLGECHSGGLPKNDLGNAMAICHPDWGHPDRGWAAATEKLTECFAIHLFGVNEDVPSPPKGGTGLPGARVTAPLPVELPVAYFCDQLHVTTGFEDGFDEHQRLHALAPPHALLAIVQGEYDDQPDRLVDRLHHYHLAVRLQAKGLAHAPQRVPMAWPVGNLVNRPFPGRAVLKHLCEAINARLAIELGACQHVTEAAAVIDAHFAKPSTQPVAVFALLPDRDRATAAALRHLVACLDLCTNAHGKMAKLALYCVDEQPGARAHWARQLPVTQRMTTLALLPLKPVDEAQLRQWYVQYQLEPIWPWLDCLALFRRTVLEVQQARGDVRPSRSELRLRQWADAVQRHRPDVARYFPQPPTAAAAA